jgi:Fic family protein
MALIFESPELGFEELRVLEMIEALRHDLRHRVAEPHRWIGGLRRVAFARNVQASNSIEGYNASLDDVVAAADGEALLDADTETQFAVEGYRDAMTYVLQVIQDPSARLDEGLLKSLHFMMLRHDLGKHPGRWRPGAIYVRREETEEIVYEGPDVNLVSELIAAMLAQIEDDPVPPMVRAALAHLNLVMIHPFSDGNGRMARALQTLVLAREQILAPVFSSIEEYLGRNTPAYYEVLAEVGQGHWNPGGGALPWVRFCLTAHYRQAKTLIQRITEAEQLWIACRELARAHGLPERCVGALSEAAQGFRIRRATYMQNVQITFGDEVSRLTASRDLKSITDAGLYRPIGDTRGRYYLATDEVKQLASDIRGRRPPRLEDDPFLLASQEQKLTISDA